METFSALLAMFAGNSPVTGEFPTQRPVTQSFGVFFDLHPNKRLLINNREPGDLRRHHAHYDVIVMSGVAVDARLSCYMLMSHEPKKYEWVCNVML